jgi:hypothetical protein
MPVHDNAGKEEGGGLVRSWDKWQTLTSRVYPRWHWFIPQKF